MSGTVEGCLGNNPIYIVVNIVNRTTVKTKNSLPLRQCHKNKLAAILDVVHNIS